LDDNKTIHIAKTLVTATRSSEKEVLSNTLGMVTHEYQFYTLINRLNMVIDEKNA